MEVRHLALAEVLEFIPRRFYDDRGFFSESYNRDRFLAEGVDLNFVQDNLSFSARRGVVRGLHYQLPPRAQDKLITVLRGAIFDVAVDIRRGSPTFGQWASAELTAERGNQLLVPKGFAHGFVTLTDDVLVLYKTTDTYAQAAERAIRFDDPTLAVGWPTIAEGYQLSDKDRAAPLLDSADLFP
jgi:dTDP-4-dehydrorhamnose 3,5-epimerase